MYAAGQEKRETKAPLYVTTNLKSTRARNGEEKNSETSEKMLKKKAIGGPRLGNCTSSMERPMADARNNLNTNEKRRERSETRCKSSAKKRGP